MKYIVGAVIGVVLLSSALALFFFIRSDLQPQAWQPAPLPTLTGAFTPNDYLSAPQRIEFSGSFGPEDVVRNAAGDYFTGLSDGRIMRFDSLRNRVAEVINTGGRPLGLAFDKAGNLIIADGLRGLLEYTPDAKFRVLTDSAEGERMKFVDALDIEDNGTIWFSDASMRFGYEEFSKDFLEASATGRLLSYSPTTGETLVQMEGLYFANGVALGPNDEFVLVSETGTGRIHRLWLKGPSTGTREVFYDGLPGNPDNLSFNGKDTFWVAMPSLRKAVNESISSRVILRKILGGISSDWFVKPQDVGFVVGMNVNAEITHVVLQQESSFSSITSVREYQDKLYLGSLTMDHLAVIPVPPALGQ